jgi:hypothetical protein
VNAEVLRLCLISHDIIGDTRWPRPADLLPDVGQEPVVEDRFLPFFFLLIKLA